MISWRVNFHLILWCSILFFPVFASAFRQTPEHYELEYVHSTLDNGYSAWNDVNLRRYSSLGADNQFVLEADYKNHFDASAALFGLTYTRTYTPEWYQDFSASVSTDNHILPGWLVFSELHRKFLSDESLVAGLGAGYIATENPYSDVYGLAELTYYFPQWFSLQGGVRMNRSSPASVVTYRYYGLINFSWEEKFEAFVRYEWGREGYALVGNGDYTPNDFASQGEIIQLRYWFENHFGVSTNLDFYQSPFYNRNSIGLSLLYQF